MTVKRNTQSRSSAGNSANGRDKSFLAVSEKLFRTLETFTSYREGDLALDEITKKTGLPKSTAFRLLNSLEKCGYLTRSKDSGRYSLGQRFFDLTNSTLPYERLIAIARPYLQSLMLTFAESTNLGVFDDGRVAHIFTIDSPKGYRVAATVGDRAYLHCTGMGKAIAAHVSPETLEKVVQKYGLPRHTAKTITTMQRFAKELEEIRRAGISHDDNEDVEGVECFGSPLFGADGKIIAAISISGPAIRMTPQAPAMRAAVLETGRRISFALGWTPASNQ